MSLRARFQDRWLSSEMFKPWLARVDDSPSKVYCKICKKVLSAEISSLKRHRLSKTHEDRCKNKTENSGDSALSDDLPAHNSGFGQPDNYSSGVTYATILMVVFLAEHNLPMRYKHVITF